MSYVRLSIPRTLQHSGISFLTDLSMASALGYQCQVSVQTTLHDSQWLLVLTMSISDCLSSDSACAGEHSALYLPAVTLKASQSAQRLAYFLLFPADREKAKWQTISAVPIASVWCPPEFTVTFWHRSDAKWGESFKLAVWDVLVCGTPAVSRRMSSRSS